MTLRLARTGAEAHAYMALHPCEACGEREFTPGSSVVTVDGDLASRYAGPCPRCTAPREFTFRIPEEVIVPDVDEPVFGAGRPSELIDAGEWLWLADLIARTTPARPHEGMSAQDRRQARLDLRTAAAAVGEAARFVPPGGDTVPARAIRSDRGRAVFEEEPGRFRRARLEAVQRTYREVAERFDD